MPPGSVPIWMLWSIRILVSMTDDSGAGLLDTSVVIELGLLDPESLPATAMISAVTLAELAVGPHATDDLGERARRQDRLQRVEAAFEPLPLDRGAARAFGLVVASVARSGRGFRGAKSMDLLIAAIAVANDLPLYTRNKDDFAGLEGLVKVIEPTFR